MYAHLYYVSMCTYEVEKEAFQNGSWRKIWGLHMVHATDHNTIVQMVLFFFSFFFFPVVGIGIKASYLLGLCCTTILCSWPSSLIFYFETGSQIICADLELILEPRLTLNLSFCWLIFCQLDTN